ncbi:MAG: hypothetical protein ACRDKI_06045, partial [Solirubrobacterales bacterium]
MAEKTTTGRLIAAAGGIVLIISLFLSWYGLSGTTGNIAGQLNIDTSFSGWQSLDIGDFVLFLIGLLAITPAALDIFDLELELPFDKGLAILVGGGIAVAWVILRILDKPGGGIAGSVLSLKFGIFVALVGAALVTFGGFTQRGEDENEMAAAPQAAPAAGMPPQQPAAPAAPP